MFEEGVLTMKNYGQRRNCTVSIIFPEQIHLVNVDVGVTAENSIAEAEVGLTDQVCVSFYLENYNASWHAKIFFDLEIGDTAVKSLTEVKVGSPIKFALVFILPHVLFYVKCTL